MDVSEIIVGIVLLLLAVGTLIFIFRRSIRRVVAASIDPGSDPAKDYRLGNAPARNRLVRGEDHSSRLVLLKTDQDVFEAVALDLKSWLRGYRAGCSAGYKARPYRCPRGLDREAYGMIGPRTWCAG
jgi:hypothetical protein